MHTEIALPVYTKETFFFDHNYNKGWGWYEAHFRDDVSHCKVGEIGPTYFGSDQARERIRHDAPDAKIIISVRNPIERTYSLLVHEYAKGRISDDFLSELNANPWMAESGRYARHVPLWEQAFGDNVMFVLQEDVEARPLSVIDDFCSFVGVDALIPPSDLLDRYGQKMVPRSRTLSRIAAWGANALRQGGMHSVVEFGKRIGLKRVYEGGDEGKVLCTPELLNKLQEIHHTDIEFIEKRLNQIFPHWRKYSETGDCT